MRVLPRLYPILDVDAAHARGMSARELAGIWIDAGVRLFQVRAKALSGRAWLELVEGLVEQTRPGGVQLIVNDRADIARMTGAAGVHVGQDDIPPAAAREVVGLSALIGLSTHTDAQVDAALREPVDYVAMGPVYATGTKAAPDPVVGESGVSRAAAKALASGLPLVAIGGITLALAPAVIAAGASSAAVISDLLVGDPAVRIRQFLTALTL